ncbi:MAG TPA: alkaline phosphatase family protein [Gammaproteobacteria bacterium]|nr:alkaline phosphatase family protein [Gammaproteobacteria bacterium]
MFSPSRKSLGAARVGLLALAILLPSLGSADTTRQAQTPIVVMLSLDGFRYDYLDQHPLQSPNLRQMAASGLQSTGLLPGFPSSTFSNHYSIVTGLYPGNHGIIGNGFYDRSRGERYRLGDRQAVEDGTWYGGEPLWVAAEKAGLRAASFFWVGSEADVQGIRPSYYKTYDGSIANSARVDQVLEWLSLPVGQRPNLVTLYFSTVDTIGHRFGPNSPQLRQAIASVDKDVGRLMAGLNKINQPIYLLISSDHGMQQVDHSQIVYLAQYIELEQWRGANQIITGSAYAFFYSADKVLLEQTASGLSEVPGMLVLDPKDFPATLNFPQRGPRIPDLIAVVDAPKYISFRVGMGRSPPQGAHGYLPQSKASMKGIFYATGPDITPGSVAPDIENVHLYPLVMEILGLTPSAPIDGDIRVLGDYLLDTANATP